MIAVVEKDRRLARRLAAALAARGCPSCVASDCVQALGMLRAEAPCALYVSEALQRKSGGDLLAELERDERLSALPGVVRVSRRDSVFARAMRRGGLRTVVAPIDVEAVADTLARMARRRRGRSFCGRA